MNETQAIILFVAALAVVVAYGIRERSRRREAAEVARTLVPEIRTVLASLETEPVEPLEYAHLRERLPRVFPKDTLFAVETFYQCNDALREASAAMAAAFTEGSELSLGDRIRAKDRRDRCLKDVHYTGAAAVERLSRYLP
ncbi:MAG TPA: hypothetical protein VEK15_30180 [Vicinamibacteria bacterium]|nr:hypothetical protein [Vicinamibacteria bacterium]